MVQLVLEYPGRHLVQRPVDRLAFMVRPADLNRQCPLTHALEARFGQAALLFRIGLVAVFQDLGIDDDLKALPYEPPAEVAHLVGGEAYARLRLFKMRQRLAGQVHHVLELLVVYRARDGVERFVWIFYYQFNYY